MESMRKIFTGLDFGGRRIKGAKIEDQPYYVPFNFSDDNSNTPVPKEIVDELIKIYNDSIAKGINSPTIYLNRAGYFQKAIIFQAADNGISMMIADMNIALGENVPRFDLIGIIINTPSNTWMCMIDMPYEALFKIINIDDNINHFNSLRNIKFAILIADNYSYLASVNMDQYGTRIEVECIGYNHFFDKIKHIKIEYTNDSIEILKNEDVEFGGSGTSFYTLDLNNYTTTIFNELSAMTLGTTIQVIDKSGRPILCQLADIEPDYIVLNSYMQYDDYDEDPHIVSYTLNADGTLQDPIERIVLEITGGGTKFLSDLGDYREIKNNDTYNVVTANYTSEHFNELLDAINNKKSVFVDGVAMTPMEATSDMILLLSNVQYVRATISLETSSETKHILSTNAYSFLPDGTYETGGETLPTNGNGTKFLSDDGTYKEVKTSDLTNTKVTQEEYNALEAAGTLDANTIYYIIG